MKLSDVITLSKYSELNTLSIKSDTAAIVAFINLGLLAIYNKFPLKTEEFVIELVDGVTIYDLPSDFMYMTGAYEAPPEYSNLESSPLPINEESNPFSVNTINFSQVQVPLSTSGAVIGILYVPKPTTMTVDNLDAELPIPDQLIDCLLMFIAHKGHSGIRVDGQPSESDVYYARFNRMCDELRAQGTSIASDDLSMDSRLFYRGFP